MTCHAARRTSEFERRLRRERREVYKVLETADAELAGRERHQPGDFVDDAATETACGVLASLEDRERRVLAEIEAAEARLAMGTFGVCASCARPIAVERLRALPTARLCVRCEDRVGRRNGGAARTTCR
jgi:DnaK suppressor protein